MGGPRRTGTRLALAALLGTGLVASGMAITPALADTAGTGVVINEAYLKGGSANAPFKSKFVELYNPGSKAVSLEGSSLQYRSATSTGSPSVAALKGSIPAHGYFLVSMKGNGDTGADLPTPDQDLGSSLNPSGTTGTLVLAHTTSALTLPVGSVTGNAQVTDLLGYGTSNTFETKAAPVDGANSVPNSLTRTDFKDTDSNAVDLHSVTDVTPQNSTTEPSGPGDPGDPGAPEDPGTPEDVAINAIQGKTDTSPYVGKNVTTRGIVTATYPTGGFNGYYIQTPGTGGAINEKTHKASDAVFVYSPETVNQVREGDYVEVTGSVSEFNGLTEVSAKDGSVTQLKKKGVGKVKPAQVAYPTTDAARERYEGMLLSPRGDFTVSDNYDTNYYGEIGLAAGTAPFYNPTVKGLPGSAAYKKAVAARAAGEVTLDDGSSINFNTTKTAPLPYLSTTDPVRVGAKVKFTKPVVLDYRNSTWKFQPTRQLTPSNAATVQPATFKNTRTAAPKNVGGDIKLAGFNVLNYFTTLGADLTGCKAYTDKDGNPITVASGCDARGAWDKASFQRQQSKIVSAINSLGANVVSLEEIENSARFGLDRDASLKQLVDALNSARSLRGGKWDYVRSPNSVPKNEDVIRTGFIYKKDSVAPTGDSVILDDPAFANARQPLAQHFTVKKTGLDLVVIANHFKSKGDSTGEATGDNKDLKDGRGAYNGDRTRQAQAVVKFAKTMEKKADTQNLFMIGDFNSYAAEDPITTIQKAGFTSLGATTGKETYTYDGGVGSLDYVFASPAAKQHVTRADEWNINSVESVALEYSRYNYNARNLYADGPYRSSDHDPIIVGIKGKNPTPKQVKRINLLNINDFHGRIDENTVKFAGTVEQLRSDYPDSTLFLSDGDNIGASLFASAVDHDKPTLDVLNALDLKASAVGNHEFDQGQDDLTGRVSDQADFPYLAANVTKNGKSILPGYQVITVDGVKVGVIGAVTQETPTLVSPGGITGLKFGDPVAAVNKVAKQLTDGNKANGEADVLVAEYHEGSSDGVATGATLDEALEHGGAFKDIVQKTSPKVSVIFNGHTHAQYAWDAPVPGAKNKTRPVLQTGSYGEHIGQVVLNYNKQTKATTAIVNRNVARSTADDATLVKDYAAVAKVKEITDAALAKAEEVGSQKIGEASADITTAFKDGARDDRASESTLGNLVADALVDTLSSEDRGGAEIGVVNPGGLRADLAKGDITYAQANAVLPFLNNLWTTTLTGAQFKEALEQQWQTTADGTTPSRPYLQLGLSKNVSYTYDASRAQGDRITSITVNGAPIDPAKEYRIGSFSFLLQGGDNFRAFAQGSNTRDSGLVDRDAWIDYLTEHSPVAPSYARHGVAVTGLPTGPVAAGTKVKLSFTGLDLTSKGVPANTELTAKIGDTTVSAPVSNGAATITVPVNASGTLTVTADPSGTVVTVPITVK